MNDKEIKLTHMTKACGCAAKLGPGTLAKVTGQLPEFKPDDNLLVGFDTSDDATVYKISDDLAIIQTLDFFTPVVDDPYTFGQVAAANALSDVYAMGGDPKIALNIVGFPNRLDPDILIDIMKGGADKVAEAGATLAGGHSIQNEDPLYGLSVTGFVRPDRVLKNFGAKPGDILILTKQVGVGIVNTSVKADMSEEASVKEAVKVMTTLNKYGKEVMEAFPVHACTDVTGFGLLGHATEMAVPSNVTLEIYAKGVAYIKGVKRLAEGGLVPAGAYRNRDYFGDKVDTSQVDQVYSDMLFDPQTSGGLLFSVEAKYGPAILEAFRKADIGTVVSVIGNVRPFDGKYIRVI